MASIDAARGAVDRGACNGSRTTSDFDTLRPRDSASISATNGSGSRTVRVFMKTSVKHKLNGSGGPDDDNCTFKFAQRGDPNLHPDAICWERKAGRHKGTTVAGELYELYRQQFRKVHFPALDDCGGRPGDLEGIRACVLPVTQGVKTPCGTKTGRFGCAACER